MSSLTDLRKKLKEVHEACEDCRAEGHRLCAHYDCYACLSPIAESEGKTTRVAAMQCGHMVHAGCTGGNTSRMRCGVCRREGELKMVDLPARDRYEALEPGTPAPAGAGKADDDIIIRCPMTVDKPKTGTERVPQSTLTIIFHKILFGQLEGLLTDLAVPGEVLLRDTCARVFQYSVHVEVNLRARRADTVFRARLMNRDPALVERARRLSMDYSF